MKSFAVVATLLAVGSAAPTSPLRYGNAGVAYGNAGVAYGNAGLAYGLGLAPAAVATHTSVVPAGPVQAHVSETVHPGPAVAQTYVQHGVVGHRTVQVGSQPVQVGHEFYVADQKVTQEPAVSFTVGEPINTAETRPLAPPALPVAAYAGAAIPPAPTNQGPAPLDTVTQEVIQAPVRTHTRITPRITRVEPELKVNRYAVDVPVHVPVAVEREVLVTKNVHKPYAVEVPRAVPVAVPHKVHEVHEVVETPVIREHTVSVHGAAYATAVHPVATGAILPAHAGYAIPALKKEY